MSEAAMIVRFACAVAAIAALLGGLAFALRLLRGRMPVLGSRSLRVVETALLTNGAAVHIVQAGEQTLVVGSASGGVTLLCPFTQERVQTERGSRGPDTHAA